MTISYKNGASSWINVNQPSVKTAATVWSPAKRVLVKTASGWEEVWPQIQYYTFTGVGYGLRMDNLFGNPTIPRTYVFINNGIIGGTPGLWALATGNFPAGSTLIFVNNGRVEGMGGKGGWYNQDKTNTPPANGTSALLLNFPCQIDNTNGYIYGGGGGGGGSAEWGGSNDNNAPGGGGAGYPPGDPGDVTWRPGFTYDNFQLATPDAGGWNNFGTAHIGIGGGPGAAGGPGANVGSSTNLFQQGAAPGNAIDGYYAYCTSMTNPNNRIVGALT